jgi:cysteinyl-tRNA synthetase
MDLRLYNTLTKQEPPPPFVPIEPNNVRMYVCGPTVYDFAHIGNARPIVVFDLLFRLLRKEYGEKHVTYVRNITDVDDKINERAARDFPGLPLNEAIRKVTEETEKQFEADVKALRCLAPTFQPRATEHIEEMRQIIERLVAKGNAYVERDHVLFKVESAPHYGQLSRRSLDEMIAGARIDVAPYKRGEMDFVLWKPSGPGEPSWPSPANIPVQGRPGWHIECSAMAWKYLRENFDIHGGGVDLVFPHHENELAQSCCAFNEDRMANVWMHNGFLQVEGAKMSKSLGNFYTIRDLRKKKKFGGRTWTGDILKFALLQTHYRQPIDFTVTLLEQTEARLERWKNFAAERTVRHANQNLMSSFFEALADDLNTPYAFAVVDRVANDDAGSEEDRFAVYQILKFLGLRTRTSRTARVANSAMGLIRSLGAFSRNDWDNLSRNVSIRSEFRSGTLKPESKLFVSLEVLSELQRKLGLPLGNLKSEEIGELRRRLLNEGVPAESGFETRVRRLIEQREEARKNRDYTASDRIRDELLGMKVIIKDTKEGTTWEIAR